ncbi:DUF5317 family protein [Pseudofrankia sp. BMG5.37]|uniref:DUF5317 family protein n=1 Tax=Pseudofrankia sp. BMG5.37 TaxID=3050035 RepID=UPI002895FD67|nr:DUF5317 family protein [Pseudofrankia sp. BMG5.37]MDT3441150.1 DUF5317 family protein [Pseudofrankia sp. BMG5.37]
MQTTGVFVLLVLALLIGLLVARLRGGTLDALGRIRVRLGWLAAGIVLALVIAALVDSARTVGWIAAAALAAALTAANRRVPGLFLLFFGLALNAAVIGANHGQMPVSTAAISSAGVERDDVASSRYYTLAGDDTRLRVLGDVIPFPFWVAPSVLSAGDVLIVSGVALFAGLAPVRANRTLRARGAERARRRRQRQRATATTDEDGSADDADADARGDRDGSPAATRRPRRPTAALPAGRPADASSSSGTSTATSVTKEPGRGTGP